MTLKLLLCKRWLCLKGTGLKYSFQPGGFCLFKFFLLQYLVIKPVFHDTRTTVVLIVLGKM